MCECGHPLLGMSSNVIVSLPHLKAVGYESPVPRLRRGPTHHPRIRTPPRRGIRDPPYVLGYFTHAQPVVNNHQPPLGRSYTRNEPSS